MYILFVCEGETNFLSLQENNEHFSIKIKTKKYIQNDPYFLSTEHFFS